MIWKPICKDCQSDYKRTECEKPDCKYYIQPAPFSSHAYVHPWKSTSTGTGSLSYKITSISTPRYLKFNIPAGTESIEIDYNPQNGSYEVCYYDIDLNYINSEKFNADLSFILKDLAEAFKVLGK